MKLFNKFNTKLKSTAGQGKKGGSVPLVALIDSAGREVNASGFGDLLVGQKIDDVSVTFQYVLSSRQVDTTLTGTGAASIDASRLKMEAPANGDTAKVSTRKAIHYRGGHDAEVYFTAAFTEITDGGRQWVGPCDGTDGYAVEYHEGDLHVLRYNGGVLEDHIDSAGFNIDRLDGNGRSGFTLNPASMSIYRIQWGYLGKLPAVFEVFGGHAYGWIPFHVIDKSNSGTGLVIDNPHLPVTAYVESAGEAITLLSGSWAGGTVGGAIMDSDLRHFAYGNTKTISTLASVFTLRSPTTYQSKTNRVPAYITFFSAAGDGNKPVTIEIYRDATLGGPPNFQPISANNSVLEVDTAGTTVSGGSLEGGLAFDKVGSDSFTLDIGSLDLLPGESLTFAAKSASTNDVTVFARWGELF